MFKQEEEKIDKVMKKLMASNQRLSDGLDQSSIASVWADVLGATIDKYTSGIHLRKGNLSVKISSAALKNELIYEKEKLIEKLNARLGAEKIRSINIS